MQESLLAKAAAADKDSKESIFRASLDSIQAIPASAFASTHAALEAHMDHTGNTLAALWDSERYCREIEEEID
jgi:hypothetical protein